MTRPELDAIVVGAGVGGAALALALARAGAQVLLVERRAGPGNINRGDSVLPAVTRHLERWGVLDRFYQAGAVPVARMQVFHAERGFLMEAPLADPAGHPYVVLPHPEIERALTEGHLSLATARLVVGADGASSVVRQKLGLPFRPRAYPTGYYIIDFERPAAYQDAMRLHLHPDGGIMLMPQGPGVVGAAVLVHPKEADLFRAGSLEEKAAAIRRRCPLLQGCAPLPRHAHLYPLSRGHAGRYFARGAALIGDAIHVTNPTAGQGMTMAVEDAAALARHVAPVLGADARAIDAALTAYQRERRPANASLLRWSHFMGNFFAMQGALGDHLRASVFGFGQTAAGRWIQRRIWGRVATRSPSMQEVGA